MEFSCNNIQNCFIGIAPDPSKNIFFFALHFPLGLFFLRNLHTIILVEHSTNCVIPKHIRSENKLINNFFFNFINYSNKEIQPFGEMTQLTLLRRATWLPTYIHSAVLSGNDKSQSVINTTSSFVSHHWQGYLGAPYLCL